MCRANTAKNGSTWSGPNENVTPSFSGRRDLAPELGGKAPHQEVGVGGEIQDHRHLAVRDRKVERQLPGAPQLEQPCSAGLRHRASASEARACDRLGAPSGPP